MSNEILGLFGFAWIFILIALGVPIAFSLGFAGMMGLIIVMGWQGMMGVLISSPYHVVATYSFASVPLFLLMADILGGGGVARDAYTAAARWLGRLPGGLAMATTAGGALFGACSGSTIASAAVFTKISLPEMMRYAYDKKLAAGCVAVSGTLAMMIPPSIMMIFFGILTDQSIGKLLIAGILPGILLAIMLMLGIYIMARANPRMAPRTLPGVTMREKVSSLRGLWPIFILFFLIIGGLYLGWFSPSTAGAIGAAGAIAVTASKKQLTGRGMLKSLRETGIITASIFILVIGGVIFARFVSVSGAVHAFTGFATGANIPPLAFIALICLLYLFLGCFLEAFSMMVVTLPVIYPAVIALGFNGIWFGVLLVLLMQIGLITPPVGLNVYTVYSAAGGEVTLGEVFKGVVPFLYVTLAGLVLLIAFPEIALFLPNMMFGR